LEPAADAKEKEEEEDDDDDNDDDDDDMMEHPSSFSCLLTQTCKLSVGYNSS